ncbi:MAG: hypothetical protein L0287_08590 [Anaerolineae bacterium]|nr:hypothetical protein [Anaerolineae bacterium]
MVDQHLSTTLQENLITLLAHDVEYGRIIKGMIDTELFEGDYRLIAERCVEFWKVNNTCPGAHTADIVADILENKKDPRANVIRNILLAMLRLSENINKIYVMNKLREFVRLQQTKLTIRDVAERVQSKQEQSLQEVEDILNEFLRSKNVAFEAGSVLADYDKVITYIQSQHTEFSTGIQHLDERGITPARTEMMMYLAPAKSGKSWFLINVGKANMLARKKVVHITLEMSEELVMQRYYQALFAVPKRDIPVTIPKLDVDDNGKLEAISSEEVEPDFNLMDPFAPTELETRAQLLGARFCNVRIKRFPPRTLTMNKLRAYLDSLEVMEHFVPDLLILDYIGIVKTDPKNHRISLGHAAEEFRAVLIDRNIAGVTAHQVSKEGSKRSHVTEQHVAEDWSMIFTADCILTYSRTTQEKKLGLARVAVTNARTEEDKFSVVISQAYSIGQYVIESATLSPNYYELLDDEEDGDEENGDD